MEIWALCEPCDAWFPARDWFDRSAPEPTCPTCGREPQAIENRAARRALICLDDAVLAAG